MWTIQFTFIAIIVLSGEKILLHLRQQSKATVSAHLYLVGFLPSLLLHGYTEAYRRYLNCYDIAVVPLVIAVASTCVNFALTFQNVFDDEDGV